MQAGALAGQLEGTATSLGLLYTTLAAVSDQTMVPNSVVLSAAVIPPREPDAVDFIARLRPEVRPKDLQVLLERSVTVPTRTPPHISLRERDDDEVVVRVTAIPVDGADGAALADEVLAAVDRARGGEVTVEHMLGDLRAEPVASASPT